MFKKIFEKHDIEFCASVPFGVCTLKNERLLQGVGFIPKSVIMFLIPYRTECTGKRNISLYAVPRDYHLFAKELFSDIIPELSSGYGARFCGFADHSPVAEVDAACRAGLGVRGDNGLLINRRYGSYCFIGEVLTDASLPGDPYAVEECLHCGACRDACPAREHCDCLSAVTQKKGELSEEESAAVKKYGSVWGCDICQEVCPMNAGCESTPIVFFKTKLTPYLTYCSVKDMSDAEFGERAYSWRGRKVLLRNLSIAEDRDG